MKSNKKPKISVYKEPVKNMYNEWTAIIDYGNSQIQLICDTRTERNKIITKIKYGLKSL